MPRAETRVPALSDRLPIWAVIAASLAGYTILWRRFPLLPNYSRAPAVDIRALAPTIGGGLAYAALLLILFALLAVAYHRIGREDRARSLPALLGVSTLFALPLLLAYPINATDLYRYVIRGRITSVYGANPFAAPPAAFPADPFLPLAGEWAGETSPYGPLWEAVAGGLTAISGDNLPVGLLLFKLLGLLCFLAMAALIWSLLSGTPARPALAVLWAWNPALLLTFVVNGHNDALMLLWLVLGLWLARRGRPVPAFWVMALAALTKPVAVLALPFLYLELVRQSPAGWGRARVVLVGVGGAAIVGWLAFLPWVERGQVFQAPVNLALRLVREATGSAGFSPPVWVYMALGQRAPIQWIGLVARVMFAAFALWLLWRAWRGRPALRGVADIFLGYVATALSFRLWYAVWPFPWLLLDAGAVSSTGDESRARSAYRLRVGFWFLVTTQLSVVLYGHFRVFVLGGSQTAVHLIGVPFTFLLPWLLAGLSGGARRPPA